MTDEELDAEIRRMDDELRRQPGGAEFLARSEAIARERGEDAAARAEIEYLENGNGPERKGEGVCVMRCELSLLQFAGIEKSMVLDSIF